MIDLSAYFREKQEIIERELQKYLSYNGRLPKILDEAMRYSVFSGGKRLRPILMIAAAETMGGNISEILPFACAVEMIHTYSLIHDDLPSMDDDEFRRGKPTSHRVFGEAVAILAGDALLSEAFYVMAKSSIERKVDYKKALRVIYEIAEASGPRGMVAGQVGDITMNISGLDQSTVESIHLDKTARLITVSLRAGFILSGANEEEIEIITKYGNNIGLAFQIMDDLMDAGKEKRGINLTSIIGIEETKKRMIKLIDEAVETISVFGEKAELLKELARFVIERRD